MEHQYHFVVHKKFLMLCVTEAKIAAGVIVVQDMLYVYHLLESFELKVDFPWCSK